MVKFQESRRAADLAPPKNPLPYRQQLRLIRSYHTGQEILREAGGTVTRMKLAPSWVFPEVVLATSPQAARDILVQTGTSVDRAPVHGEVDHALGPSLITLKHEPWLPRKRALQPVFAKHNVQLFAGHMAEAAESVTASWCDGEQVDLDEHSRRLMMRALGSSVLGIDLDEHTDAVGEPVRTAMRYVVARATSPVKAPRWLPTPARRRSRAAADALRRLAAEILQACRDDPSRDAPLVRAVIAATDPDTGRGLTDEQICNELFMFVLGAHDTTVTMFTYALWALGRHPDIQDRVRAEADALGDRELVSEDVPRLSYTVQVLHEALRLCPPAPVIARLAVHDFEVDGYLVKAGTYCAVGVYAMQRDPELWDRPLEFDPDRFSPERSVGRDRWQFIPFSAGPRTCIGDHFAMLETTLALASIIRRAEIRSLKKDFPLALSFNMIAGAPIPAVVTRRR